MEYIYLSLVITGAFFMAISMTQYYRALMGMRKRVYEKKLFKHRIYGACFAIMVFFSIVYIYLDIPQNFSHQAA